MTDAEILGLITAGAVGQAVQQLRHIDCILPELQSDQVGCSQWLVSETQKQLIGDNKLTIPDTRVGADGKERVAKAQNEPLPNTPDTRVGADGKERPTTYRQYKMFRREAGRITNEQ